MIGSDVNLLVYAHNDNDHQRHSAARRWWIGLVDGTEPVSLPWIVITGFIRVVTHPRIMAYPLTTEQAVGCVQNWLGRDHVAPIDPGPEHLALLRQNLAGAASGANLVPDAHIAALAMEYGAEVHSNDTDFARFPGLRWRNPLT